MDGEARRGPRRRRARGLDRGSCRDGIFRIPQPPSDPAAGTGWTFPAPSTGDEGGRAPERGPRAVRLVRRHPRGAGDRGEAERIAREAAMARGSETLHGMFDAEGRVLARNDAMREMLGEESGHFLDMFADGDERRRAAAAFAGGTAYHGVGRLRVREGGPWYRIVGSWRTDPVSGRPALFVEASPVSELREEAARYRHLAETDALTGLLARGTLLGRLEELCADRRARPLSLILADLDRFKRVNDRFGHAAGDRVLVAFARALSGLLRRGDLCGRLGGEEFLLVLPRTDVRAACGVARRICDHLRTSLATLSGISDGPLTASFGVSELTSEEADPRAALERADRALYRAKAAGRGRVEPEPAPEDRR